MRSSSSGRTLFGAGLFAVAATLSACDNGSGPAAGASPTGAGSSSSANASVVATAPSTALAGGAPAWTVARPGAGSFRVVPTSATVNSDGSSPAAASLRQAVIASLQGDAGPAHAARPVGSDGYHFEGAAGRLRADLTPAGLTVAAGSEGDTSATLRVTHFGCQGELGDAAAPVRPAVAGAGRVSYGRPGWVEWYANGRLGLEQGFDLKQAPACRGRRDDAAVVLAMELRGAGGGHPLLMHGADGSEWVELRDGADRVVLRYSDLSASDADGKVLPAHMAVEGDRVSLVIDDRGARYPLRVDPLIWAQTAGLYKSTAPHASDLFGYSLAISGDQAVIGAPRDDEGATDAGAAFIFQLSSQGTWSQQAKILPTAPVAGGFLGTSVALADLGGGNKRLVLGAAGDTGVGGVAAWFVGRGTTWTPEAEFSSSNLFGTSVAVAADRVVVGSPAETSSDGAVVIYEPDLALSPPWREAAVVSGSAGSAEQLGQSVAISGGVVAIGAPSSDVGATDAGRVEVWERDPATAKWMKTGALRASDAAAGDRLGSAVSVSGRSVLAGAPGKSSGAGAAYVFTSLLGVWGQQAKLVSSGAAAGESFGSSVGLVGNLAAIGVPLRTVGGITEAGAVETFSRSGTAWSFVNQATASTPLASDRLGISIAVDGGLGHILAGAAYNDTTATDSGGFYDLILLKQNGDACAAAVECASASCIDGVCCESSCGGGSDGDCQACANAKTGQASGLCRPATMAVVCRPAAGLCDQAETCDGTAVTCPNDVFQAVGTSCRPATGPCDQAETCSGVSAICPVDAVLPTSAICRPAAGDCDIAERCDGQTKGCGPDLLKPSFTICRLSQGECDAFEVCDGTTAACPADSHAPDAAACSGGTCQAGLCRAEADVGVLIGGYAAGQAGQSLPYSVTVANAGRSAAANVSVTITVPAGATLGSPTGNGWTCVAQSTGTQCTRAALGPGELSQINFLIDPPGQAERLTVSAAVQSSVYDPNPINNMASSDQSLLSSRVSGGGFGGCSAVPGPAAGGGGLWLVATSLLLALRRRKRG